MSRKRPVVAIDGPAGAGKSTVARRSAERLGFVRVDTGALYRGVALAADERDISWDDAAALGALVPRLALGFVEGPAGSRLTLDGSDREDDIRGTDIADGASRVSRHPEVRDALLEVQRQMGQEGGVVLEGRDIGTVVFPDAEVKVFLTASAEARAERRFLELEGRGLPAERAAILASIRERDERDTSRPVAPLRPAEDAILLDSTSLSLDEVVARVVELVQAAT